MHTVWVDPYNWRHQIKNQALINHGGNMSEKSWRRRAADIRSWATEVRNPYTRIEMMALAEIYERRAEQSTVDPSDDIRVRATAPSKLSRARCGRRIEPDWRING